MSNSQLPRGNLYHRLIHQASIWLIVGTLSIALLTACSFGSTGSVVVEDSFTVGASPKLKVVPENGKVIIRGGGASPTVQVIATIKNPERVNYSALQEGDTVTVVAEVENGFSIFRGDTGANIEVVVPETIGLELDTSNGRVSVTGINGSVSVVTSNRGIDIDNLKGDLRARTSNGGIEIGRVSGQVEAETANGDVLLTATLREGSKNRIRTSNGSINVTLVDTPGVNLDASTSNGIVSSELPITTTAIFERTSLVGTIREGGPDLELRTSNGSITIR